MKLKRVYPLDVNSFYPTAGCWATADKRFVFLRPLQNSDDIEQRRRLRTWIIQPKSESNPEQKNADQAFLKSLGLLEAHFKTRREAIAALALTLGDKAS